eukprot:1408552-Pleurochrysis_carterae.AAC.2
MRVCAHASRACGCASVPAHASCAHIAPTAAAASVTTASRLSRSAPSANCTAPANWKTVNRASSGVGRLQAGRHCHRPHA